MKINIKRTDNINKRKRTKLWRLLISYVLVPILLILLLYVCEQTLDDYIVRILNLCAVYVILAVSLNLINGFTGQFSLGHAGFMAIGAYTCALLTMSSDIKSLNFYLQPIIPALAKISIPFLPALIISGLAAAVVGMAVGAPALRLKGDYLAIATLGFSEIIRVVITNITPITNGSLGLKDIPTPNHMILWTGGAAILSTIFILLFINSSYGRALKAIREDETAAQSMGIGLFRHKMLSFSMSAFFAGIGGALMGSLLSTIEPNMFKSTLTYNILLIVVLGGMGSIAGSVVSAVIVTSMMEVLRFLDEGFLGLPAIPGLRMVIFSLLLMIVIIFFPKGLLGNYKFRWPNFPGLSRKHKSSGEEAKA